MQRNLVNLASLLLSGIVVCLIIMTANYVHAQNLFRGVLVGITLRDSAGINQIVTIDSTGAITHLTSPGKYHTPTFSPDGTKIVYSVLKDTVVSEEVISALQLEKLDEFNDMFDYGEFPKPVIGTGSFQFKTRNLWIMNADGSKKEMLSDPQKLTFNGRLKWSPDGKRIIYASFRPYGLTRGEIWEMDIDTKEEKKIDIALGAYGEEGMALTMADYSPDGQYIVFTNRIGSNNYSDIFIKDLHHGYTYNYISKLGSDSYPVWSPLGHWILLYAPEEIQVHRPEKNAVYEINLERENIVRAKFFSCDFSPNGEEIVISGEFNGEKKLMFFDRYLKRKKREIIGIELHEISWGGYPRVDFSEEIRVNGILIRNYNIYRLILFACIIGLAFYIAIVTTVYQRRHILFAYVLAGLCLLFMTYIFEDVENSKYVYITPSLALIFYAGLKSGGLLNGHVYESRKQLLTTLLQFGHAGNVTKNFDQVVFYSSNLYKGNAVDYFCKEKLFENINEFYSHSYPYVVQLISKSRKALLQKKASAIDRAAARLQYCFKKFKTFPNKKIETSYLDTCVLNLQNAIEDLTVSLEKHFFTDVRDALHGSILLMDRQLTEYDVDFHIDDSKLKEKIAVIDLLDFRFIMDNLIENAIEAVKEALTRKITVTVYSEGEKIYITVTDSGIGIHETKHKEIFYPGYSEFNKTGYGLYKSREILIKYKGKLDLEWSELAKGSAFSVTLTIPTSNGGTKDGK